MAVFSAALRTRLGEYLSEETGPGPGPYHSISLPGIEMAAQALDCTPREAMLACLEQDIWPLRFCRNRGLLNASEQARLLASHAAIIGCGGLGGIDLTLLARLGLGSLTVCDPDSFTESNLNRQCLCREDRIGMNKAYAAREELALIASHVTVRTFALAAAADNLSEILAGADIVVDGLDNLGSRQLVAQAAHQAGIPYVYASLAGLEGFACLVDPRFSTDFDPLYTATPQNALAEQRLGVPTPTPTTVAVLQCLLVLRALLKKAETETSELWHLDLSVPEIERLIL